MAQAIQMRVQMHDLQLLARAVELLPEGRRRESPKPLGKRAQAPERHERRRQPAVEVELDGLAHEA
eukprot:6205359-Lingulodinium_polyedra.AAC.1